MRLISHYIFTAGILIFINVHIISFFRAFSISIIVSFMANFFIDSLGHKMKKLRNINIYSRTPLTHTFDRSIIFGILAAMLIILIIPKYDLNHNIITACLISGLIAGPSHMILDVFTENGIFIRKNKKWKRFALMHLKYNNKIINAIVIFIGISLFFLSYKMFS